MANTKCGESTQIHGREDKGAKCGSSKTEGATRVKVQWPKSCSKVFPSCRTTTQSPTQTTTSCATTDDGATTKQEKEDQNKITQKQEEEQKLTQKPEEDNKIAQNQDEEKSNMQEPAQESCSDCKNENKTEEKATMARLRAQRRWRMGLLKRSKFGGIGEADVSDLFPDYFPSPFTIEEGSEDDDILTSLKESKQRHRAKLLKQNSIDKIDRELGDRETKLIAGSWLQIYS